MSDDDAQKPSLARKLAIGAAVVAGGALVLYAVGKLVQHYEYKAVERAGYLPSKHGLFGVLGVRLERTAMLPPEPVSCAACGGGA